MSNILSLFIALVFFVCDSYADTKQTIENLTVIDSEFRGSGSQNSSYVITASETNQIDNNMHILKGIVVKYSSNNSKNSLYASSDKGEFYSDKDVLDLYKNLNLKFNNQYQLITDRLRMNFSTSSISSDNVTEIKGINEKIVSKKGFSAHMNEKIVNFYGPITTILIRK